MQRMMYTTDIRPGPDSGDSPAGHIEEIGRMESDGAAGGVRSRTTVELPPAAKDVEHPRSGNRAGPDVAAQGPEDVARIRRIRSEIRPLAEDRRRRQRLVPALAFALVAVVFFLMCL